MQNYGRDRLWPFAQGGGATLALATGLWAAVLALWQKRQNGWTGVLAAASGAVWLAILYFFRDPNRPIDSEPGLVLSGADGEVVAIARETESRFLQRESIRISTFLGLTDVHVQRVPVSGVVTRIVHQPGKFLQAYRPEASDQNEFIAMEIETPYGPVLVKQIAGIMARRCVNYAQPGDEVTGGERFGLIRFGSRVDLFLPADAEVLVREGARVAGGITPMARLKAKD